MVVTAVDDEDLLLSNLGVCAQWMRTTTMTRMETTVMMLENEE